MSAVRRLLALSAIAVLLAGAAPARADERAELDKARASFLARNWADAERRLRTLLDPKNGLKDRPLVSQARMYLGASLLAQGKVDDAKEVFEKLVLDDPTYDPDPLSFPSDAINTLIDLRSALLEQIKAATQNAARLAAERKQREEAAREAQRLWFERVKAQAAEEKITVRHSRVIASLPFGAGQFQNREPALAWTFLGAQVAALAGTVVTYGMFRYARDREAEELSRTNRLAEKWHQRAEDIRLVNLGFVGAFVAIAAGGILQANLAFVPETAETRKRDLPPLDPARDTKQGPSSSAPRAPTSQLRVVAPIVAALPGQGATPGGVFVGVAGVGF